MKPELIAFSQYKIGGAQSFCYYLLKNDPLNFFEKKWILTRDVNDDKSVLPPAPFNCCNEVVVPYNSSKGSWRVAYQIQKHISNKKGVILANGPLELGALHFYYKDNKTVFFLCHDELYIDWAKKYSFLIDVFIAHNYHFYEELKRLLPERKKDVYFLPFGIELSKVHRKKNHDKNLSIAFIGRLHKLKGLYDIPLIDDLLRAKGIIINWTIIGDGPEKLRFQNIISKKKNFQLYTPANTEGVFELIQNSDLFLLPSSLDGTPVSMLEAMSCGLVPIVYEFNPGIKKIITQDIGYITKIGDLERVVDIIEFLDNDRNKLEELSTNALQKIQSNYDILKRNQDYYNLFHKYAQLKKISGVNLSFWGIKYWARRFLWKKHLPF